MFKHIGRSVQAKFLGGGSLLLFIVIFIAKGSPALTQAAQVDLSPVGYLPLVTEELTVPDATPCKLPEAGSHGGVGLGIPRFPDRMASLGTVRAKVIFVDFPDVAATRTPQEIFAMLSPGAPDYFEAVSYGKMDYQLEPHYTWYRMSKPSTEYAWDNLTFELHRDYIQEAVDLSDADVNFSGADQIVVMATPNADALFNGPTLLPGLGNGITVDGTTIDDAVTSGADLLGWGALWLNHESGHSMGLIDLYPYTPGPPHRFVGQFDLMGLISGFAPEFMAYSRWMLGWLEDAQIFCQQSGEETLYLSAIEQPGGLKAVMVPTGPTSLVVVESRHVLGYDAPPTPGALVYVVDSSISSGEGGIQIHSDPDTDPLTPLSVGDQVTIGNVTVEVVSSNALGDSVRVTVSE